MATVETIDKKQSSIQNLPETHEPIDPMNESIASFPNK